MRDPSRTVVVTGAAVLCHLGDDPAQIEAALREGRGLPFIRHPPAVAAGSRCQLLGSYRGDLVAERRQARFMGRAALMGYKAALAALSQSRLERRDIAVAAGSGTGDVATHIEVQKQLERADGRRLSATVIPRMMASTVSANLATALRTTGPSFTASAACSGGAYNILLAAELIEHGHVDAALAGGVEVADEHFHAGFDAMRAFNGQDNEHPARASRPYARDRAGFIFGEGAGMVVLETKADAEARGAEVPGDVSEVRALRRLFGGRRVPYSSTKGYIGHTISAAGAINAIFTLSMLRGGWIAPCINAEPLDPELDDYPPVVRPTARPLRLALSNSFGFGGTNVTLVLARPD